LGKALYGEKTGTIHGTFNIRPRGLVGSMARGFLYLVMYKDPMLKVGQISVESHKGVVRLSGFVDSSQAGTRAVELARSVKGVKSVENSLIVT
jgi:BON domain